MPSKMSLRGKTREGSCRTPPWAARTGSTRSSKAIMASHLASRILSTSTQKARRIISGRRGQQEDGRGRDHDLRDYYNARAHTNSMMETELMKSSAATSPRRPNDSRTLINFDDEQQQNESSGIGSSDAETAGPASAGASAGLVHYYVCMPSGGLEAVTEEQAGARAALRHSPSPSDSDHFRGEGDGDDGRSRASSSHGGATGVSLGGDRPMIAELLHFARHRNWKKKVLTLFIVVTSLLVFYDLLFLGHIRTWIASALDWMTLNPFGAVFSFIVFFVVATLLFVPPAILMFGAGYAFSNVSESFWFGFFASSVVSFVGCVLGAIAAFLRSRYMMRDLIELFSKRYPIVNALDRAMERKGFRVMLLLRLCPIIPFNGLNHIGGVMNVSLENYTKALVGIIPTILLLCFSGASADHAMRVRVEEDGPEYMYAIILFSSGLAFGLIAAVLIWRFAIQELRKEIDQDSAETWFRYKSHGKTAAAESGASGSDADDTSSRATSTAGEAGHEMTLQEHELVAGTQTKPRRGILALLRIDAEDYGLDTYYEGPDDGRDEEWYWLWA